jgi:hypothetical protein
MLALPQQEGEAGAQSRSSASVSKAIRGEQEGQPNCGAQPQGKHSSGQVSRIQRGTVLMATRAYVEQPREEDWTPIDTK